MDVEHVNSVNKHFKQFVKKLRLFGEQKFLLAGKQMRRIGQLCFQKKIAFKDEKFQNQLLSIIYTNVRCKLIRANVSGN